MYRERATGNAAPETRAPGNATTAGERLDGLRVYLITDRTLLPENEFLRGIESALKGGIRSLQLREKDLPASELLHLARQVKALAQPYGAKLFINDRADIAEIAGADGVHLTETSIAAADVKKHFPRLLIGVSTHSLESARRAEAGGADFVTFGPVFDTPSKRIYGPPQGLYRLREVAGNTTLPVLALGGVKSANIPLLLAQGVYGVALVSGIWKSSNIEEASHQYRQYFPGEHTNA